MSSSAELAATGFFEDFAVGERMRHARGKNTDADMSLLTLLVMNTAQGHFNEHRQERRQFGTRINSGGLTLALVTASPRRTPPHSRSPRSASTRSDYASR